MSKILVVSLDRSWDTAKVALRTGALGYIANSDAARELLPAVRAVLQGGPFLSFGLTDLDSIQFDKERPAISTQREGVEPSKIHGFEILSNEVRLYRDDAAFVDGLPHSTAAALEGGGVAVVVAAESDHARILRKLSLDGMDTSTAAARKRYIPLKTDKDFVPKRELRIAFFGI